MILVTGATGFIGAQLVARFAGQGQEVLACDARPPSDAVAKAWGKTAETVSSPDFVASKRMVTFVTCDVRDRAAVKALVERAGASGSIVHLAGILTAGCDLNPNAAMQVNLMGFQHVLDAATAIGKNRVVLVSTIGVYGRDLPQPIVETARTEPDGWYGYTKLACELMGLLCQRRNGLDFRAARLAAVTGPGREAASGSASLFTSFIPEKAALGEPYEIEVTEDTAYPVVYIKDAVEALYTLATVNDAPSRIYNVSSGRVIVNEMVAYVKSKIPGAKFTFKPNPVVMSVVSGYKDWQIGCESIRRDVGWEPAYGVQAMIDDIIETVQKRRR